jgi:hypothetical protein
MDELINQVAQKTGISHDQAKQAAETVIGFLKDKLPAPLAGQIDGALSGGASGDLNKTLGDLGGSLGGMLGK